MLAIAPKHLITADEFNKDDINEVLTLAGNLKKYPKLNFNFLGGKHIAIVFEKPSLRTRFSFATAIHQLGGVVIESLSQTRKFEEPKDFIRVVQGYCSALVIRTFEESDLYEMQAYSKIPIINGLTNGFHPCQSLADLMTLKERFNTLQGLKLAYIGDGNNVLHSLMIMGVKLGIEIHYCCPKGHGPKSEVLDRLENRALIKSFSDPKEAVKNCHAVYTDVWTSMGFESKNEAEFEGFQVNEALMSHAHKDAVFMHCMPMERGKEVSVDLPDAPCSLIFQQSENRLHVQKALLVNLLS